MCELSKADFSPSLPPKVDLVQVHKYVFRSVDGSAAENLEERNKLFGISGIRGNYPQTFKETDAGDITFVGDWEKVEGLNECEGLPEDVKAANPTMPTLSNELGDIKLKD